MKSPSPTSTTVKHVALDVHAETLAVGIAEGIEAVRIYGTVPATTHAFDRLHAKLSADGSEVRYVYEAGPTGFWLSRHLAAKGISVGVVSPAQVPKKAGDRIKTDRRDASHLARLFRAGELAFIHVPDEADEAMRDLVRTRLRAVEDLRTCRQRIQGMGSFGGHWLDDFGDRDGRLCRCWRCNWSRPRSAQGEARNPAGG